MLRILSEMLSYQVQYLCDSLGRPFSTSTLEVYG